jgi:predicted transcriptional regulator
LQVKLNSAHSKCQTLCRIGPNGKPLKGEKELSTQQKQIVDENKKEIRREINKVGKEIKRIEENE